MLRALLVLLLAGALFSAPEKKPPKLPADVQQVVGMAMAAPPEFAADALLRLLAAGKIADPDAKREYIELAFRLAGRAQHPFPVLLVKSVPPDTREGFQSMASRLKLDRLSLQTRAAGEMFSVSKTAARELFDQIPHVAEPLTCDSALVPDLSAYYEAALRVAQNSFTSEQREKNESLRWFQVVLDRISSHVELAPAASAIAAMDWSQSQFEVVLGSFLGKLQSLAHDDRSFSISVRHLDAAIPELQFRAKASGAGPARIAEAYRGYLAANLSAARCAGNGSVKPQFSTGATDGLELFGESIRAGLPPLTADETRPTKVEGEAKVENYWEAGEAKRVYEECLRLRKGPDGQYLTEWARNTREWKLQLVDFLDSLAGWKVTGEKSEAAYTHQKAIVFEALLEMAPAGPERNRVLGEYLAFLRTANLQQENPVEWYWHARSVLNRLRATRPDERDRLMAAYEASGNVILTLQAALDRMAPDYSMFPPQ